MHRARDPEPDPSPAPAAPVWTEDQDLPATVRDAIGAALSAERNRWRQELARAIARATESLNQQLIEVSAKLDMLAQLFSSTTPAPSINDEPEIIDLPQMAWRNGTIALASGDGETDTTRTADRTD